MSPGARAAGRLGVGMGCLVGLGILAFASFILTIVLAFAIWPGEAKLTAPLFCPDDQPDAFVVTDTYSPQPGETSTNYTLYCMGPRGEVTDKGIFRPFLVLTLAHAVLLVGLFLAFALLFGPWRRARKALYHQARREARDAKARARARASATPQDAITKEVPPQDAAT